MSEQKQAEQIEQPCGAIYMRRHFENTLGVKLSHLEIVHFPEDQGENL